MTTPDADRARMLRRLAARLEWEAFRHAAHGGVWDAVDRARAQQIRAIRGNLALLGAPYSSRTTPQEGA